MPSTLRRGRTDIAALLTVDDCLAAKESAFRAHGASRTLPPAIQGVVALFDAANGTLLALMDSMEITGLRTAAATAIAARHLARSDARVLGVFGCGTQGRPWRLR